MKPSFQNKPITNFDIMKWINFMSVDTFGGVISRDQIRAISSPGYYISNLNDSSQSGSHWVAILVKDSSEPLEYFDSFGLNAPMEVVELSEALKVNYLFNSTQYQDLNSVLCGYWCLYFVNESQKGRSYFELLKPLSHTDTRFNERMIVEYFQNL